ncbi:WD40 repeat domain-containing protein [Nocardia sp. NPDC003979]
MTETSAHAHDDADERDRLIGKEQQWLRRCTAAIGAPGAFDELRAALAEGEQVYEALQSHAHVDWPIPAGATHPEPPAEYNDAEEIPTPLMAAARVILTLAEALDGHHDSHDAISLALRHFDACGVHSVGNHLLGKGGLTSGAGPLPELVARLVGEGAHPSRGFVILLLGVLAGRSPKVKRSTRVPVVFVSNSTQHRNAGDTGWLTVSLLDEGPSGLHADPELMAFLLADTALDRGLAESWEASGLPTTDSCVIWSVTDSVGNPCDSLQGDSMAAAFAVALDDLAPRTTLRRLRRLRSLDPNSVVTAGLRDKTLTKVEGYEAKLDAARAQQWRVVVAGSALDEAAATGIDVKIIGADSVDDAITATRTRVNTTLVGVLATLAVVLTLVIPIAAVGYSKYQESRRAELATELAALSREKVNQDSRLAALLALAGDSLNSTETTRAAMRTVAENNKSVVASAHAADSAVEYVASYGTTVLTAAWKDDSVKAWALPDMRPLGEISVPAPVWGIGGGGYRATGMFAVVAGSTLRIYQGVDGVTPGEAAVFESGFGGSEIFGPFVDPESNAVVAFDANYRGLFWAPGMEEPDRFDLSVNAENSIAEPGIADETVVAVSNFNKAAVFEPSIQQAKDTSNQTVTIAGSNNTLRQFTIEAAPGQAPPSEEPGNYDSPPDTRRIYSTRLVTEDAGAPIHAVAISSEGSILAGTDDGLKQFHRHGDDADVNGLIRDRITDFAYLGLFSDEFAVVTSKGLGYVEDGRLTAALTNTTADAAVDRAIRSIAKTQDGTVVAGRADGSVFVHDPANSMTRLKQRYGATALGFTPDGLLMMAGVAGKASNEFGRIALEEMSREREAEQKISTPYGLPVDVRPGLKNFRYTLGDVEAQVFSVAADERYAAAAGYRRSDAAATVWIWNRSDETTESHFRVLRFPGSRPEDGPDLASAVTLSADGSRVYGLSPSRAVVVAWDSASGDVLWTRPLAMESHPDAIIRTSATVDTNRKLWLIDYWSQGQRAHAVIDLDTGEIREPTMFADYQDSFLSPDGSKVAVTRANEVAIYSIKGEQLVAPVNLGYTVGAVAWSPDSTRMAIDLFGSGQITFRSADRLDEVAPVWRVTGLGDLDQVAELAWSPDGNYLAASTGTNERGSFFRTKNVEVLLVENLDMRTAMCNIAGSDLTTAEWSQYVGNETEQFPLCVSEGDR